jgi:predicted type IV restriction endonuclease/energy-coupling factor transporter ATP-binding protein EcfA2
MKNWNIDDALNTFRKIITIPFDIETLTESDTRSKLIDRLLIDCLGWSEENIIREEHCRDSGTYLDYKLSTNMPLFIIEAKKSSINFNLPKANTQKYYKIGGVLSKCDLLVKAMIQARDYAISKGIVFCVVTNGIEYIFFRAQNQQGIEWVDHTAIVFRNAEDIEENFDLFCSLLAKISAENGQLQDKLRVTQKLQDVSTNFKTLNANHLSLSRSKDRNPLFPYIGEIIHKVFQDLAVQSAESEILEHCYVDSPNKVDKKSPFIDINSKPLIVSKKEAGDFQKRIITTLKAGKTDHKEIVLILGSVGVGKSTFIQRFRKVLAKKEIDKKGIWIYLNFKNYSDTGESLDDFIYKQIKKILVDEYEDLGIFDWAFLKQIYHSEYNLLKQGPLAPLYKKSPDEFEQKFGDKVDSWINNDLGEHLQRLLKIAAKRFERSVFLVFDNADQLNPNTQNDIFLISEKLSTNISCYALLSMREESYWKTRDSGPLNAFHTTAYNVQPASFEQVLSKRFKYTRSLLQNKIYTDELLNISGGYDINQDELIRVFDRLVKTLLGKDNRYIEYIESMSARDTRRALDTVAAFMISGHTNLAAILKDERKVTAEGFDVPYHEFLNAIILRDHESYSESYCDVLNIFNTSGGADISNFNRIIVLSRILHCKNNKTNVGTGYISIEDLVNDCNSIGILTDTSLSIIRTFNSRRLIETETSIKDETLTSKYVRITSSGAFYLEKLVMLFGYLEIVLFETPIGNDIYFKKMQRIYGELNKITSKTPENRYSRVKKRLELTEIFLDYLLSDFNKNSFRKRKDLFNSDSINLMQNIRINFNKEKKVVLQRAQDIFKPIRK